MKTCAGTVKVKKPSTHKVYSPRSISNGGEGAEVMCFERDSQLCVDILCVCAPDVSSAKHVNVAATTVNNIRTHARPQPSANVYLS